MQTVVDGVPSGMPTPASSMKNILAMLVTLPVSRPVQIAASSGGTYSPCSDVAGQRPVQIAAAAVEDMRHVMTSAVSKASTDCSE